jgi:hypothetical protein
MPTHRTPPWKKPRPKQTARTKLTPASIAKARAAAKKAGRRYPNLVDNMAALRAQVAAEKKAKGSDRPR